MKASASARLADRIDRTVGWWRLPRSLGLAVLVGIRDSLRTNNLYDGGRGACPPAAPAPDPSASRTVDGTGNDSGDSSMGSVGWAFGRNVPPAAGRPEPDDVMMEPNPRTISNRLLARDTFQPAWALNVLSAAWIQFEVHDWLAHGTSDGAFWEIPLAADDPWPQHPMKVLRGRPHPNPGGPVAYASEDTHWWDASQIYGATPILADALRAHEGGRLRIEPDGLPPKETDALQNPEGNAGNFWLGLAALHSLFIREHNAICARLAAEYPQMTDQQLYDIARLINAALIAKIHTIEWTPAIIGHPTTVMGMRANWFGLLGERFARRFGRLGKSETLFGIPGSGTDHHGVPYSLTEEFVAVYRMHPLMPDRFVFRSVADNSTLETHRLGDLTVDYVRTRLETLPMADVLYTLGRDHPGSLSLHNFPNELRELQRPGGGLMDLAAVDILRNRERGVPRYNEFRKLFRLKPAASFEDLTDNPVWAEELRQVYGDVDRVDLMVGLFAEPKPPGFGFSDTAFRVFILMAVRRLKSDRFFTVDFRPEVYTPLGMAWIRDNSMRTVLLRHHPELAGALHGVKNPFTPWTATAGVVLP